MDGKQIVYPDVMYDIDQPVVWYDGSESCSYSNTHRNLCPARVVRETNYLITVGLRCLLTACLVRCWQETTGTQRNSLEHPAESPQSASQKKKLAFWPDYCWTVSLSNSGVITAAAGFLFYLSAHRQEIMVPGEAQRLSQASPPLIVRSAGCHVQMELCGLRQMLRLS